MTETEQLADVIALCVHDATAPLLTKIAALEARPVPYATKEAWDLLQASLADLQLRLAAAEARPLLVGPAGPAGRDGQDGKPGRDGEAGPMGPAGRDGQDGKPGRDGEAGPMGPAGKDGAPGLNGKDGRDGLNGRHGVDGINGKDAILPDLDVLAQKAAVLVPVPKDGRDGLPGVPGPPGKDGIDGLDGKPGLAGLNGKDGKDGRDGATGKDGLGFDDVDVIFEPAKGWLVRFTNGTRQKDCPIPIPFDAGVWDHGRLYPKGAGCTNKGAFWIAQRATKTRPGDDTPESRADWRLAVKQGRDGKPGKDGRDGGS